MEAKGLEREIKTESPGFYFSSHISQLRLKDSPNPITVQQVQPASFQRNSSWLENQERKWGACVHVEKILGFYCSISALLRDQPQC